VEKSGGIIFDLMVHDIDWLQWCFGPISRVYARGLTERLGKGELDFLDYALLTLRHASGVISHAEGTWADPGGFATTFEVAGDAGLLAHDSRRAVALTQAVRGGADAKTGGVALPRSPLAPTTIRIFAKSKVSPPASAPARRCSSRRPRRTPPSPSRARPASHCEPAAPSPSPLTESLHHGRRRSRRRAPRPSSPGPPRMR
jgi:predicted dehydrogenase